MEYQNNKYSSWTKNGVLDTIDYSLESLAMLYPVYQKWNKDLIFIETGLEKGTIFAELDKPFYGYKTAHGGCSCGSNSFGGNTGHKPNYTKPSDINKAKAGCNLL